VFSAKDHGLKRDDCLMNVPANSRQVSPAAAPNRTCRLVAWFCVLCVVVFVGLIRAGVSATPLERDEGEYAYAGQLLLQGIPPYRFAYNMKLPGVYFAYAAGMAIFGQSAVAIHLFLLLINAATIVMVFFLGTELFGILAGVTACAIFGVMSVSPVVLGMAAHANHFVILFVVPALWVLWSCETHLRKSLPFLSGLLFGMAVLMKQQAGLFALFGAVYFLIREIRVAPFSFDRVVARMALFLGGLILPIALSVVYLAAAGVFPAFWFWVVSYARKYVTVLPPSDGLEYLRRYLSASARTTTGFRLLALAGLLMGIRNVRVRKEATFLYALLVASFAAVTVGLFFRPHYFILALPSMALLCGFGVAGSREALKTRQASALVCALPIICLLLALGWAVFEQRSAFFQDSPTKIVETNYPENPFIESLAVAEYIKAHSAPVDTIGVIGSEPEIYFYAGRKSATGYIYTYALMEPQPFADTMQQEMMSEVEHSKPVFLVFVEYENSWASFPNSDRTIFNWFAAYSREKYELVGVVNRSPRGQVVSHWDEEARSLPLPRQLFMSVYKRKGGV
jgi:dolichyl-phosphate-mannose-protein mannosyltransferase